MPAGAAGARRGGVVEGDPPRRARGAAGQLGEQAADAADRHTEGHGGGEQVTGAWPVAGEPLGDVHPGPRAHEPAEDAAVAVGPLLGERRVLAQVDVLEPGAEPHEDGPADQSAGHHDEEALVRRAAPPGLAANTPTAVRTPSATNTACVSIPSTVGTTEPLPPRSWVPPRAAGACSAHTTEGWQRIGRRRARHTWPAPVAQLAEAGDLKSPQVRVRPPSGAPAGSDGRWTSLRGRRRPRSRHGRRRRPARASASGTSPSDRRRSTRPCGRCRDAGDLAKTAGEQSR